MPQFTIRGLAVPALAKIDEVMQAYITQKNIKAASVAVTRKGKLVFARAYTNEEAAYPIAQPTSLFRLASCTKVITRAAIYQLVEKNPPKLKTTDNVQAICGFTSPSNGPLPNDPQPSPLKKKGHYFNAVTVHHLLLHQGGWDRNGDGADNEPSFHKDFAIATAFGHEVPVSKQEYQRWGVSQFMQFYPGSESHYSNFGFSILGTVIEKKTGLSYIDAVMKNLFGPLGVSRPRLGLPLENERAPGEVKYHANPTLKPLPSVMDPNKPLVPVQYGSENNRLFDAFGGWIISAPDYARFLAAYGIKQSPMPAAAAKDLFSVDGTFQTASGTTINDHGGFLDGSDTYVAYRSDDVSLVVLENGNGNGSVNYKGTQKDKLGLLHELLDEVKADKWPTWDLFPLVEIPAIACDAVSWGADRLDIVARGTDGSLQHTWHDPQKGWGGWESLGLQIASAPQMVNWGESGRLDVFAWGQDHAIWHAWHHPVSGWATESLNGTLASRPHAVSWGKNRLDIFALGLDYAVWHHWHDPVTGWGKWESQGGTFATPPVAVSWGTGRLDIFALGLDYALWHLWHDPTKGWGTWENLGNTLTSPPSVVSWEKGRLDVFALGTDRTLQHLWHDPTKGWGAWESLGSTLASAPSAVSWGKGRLDIFALGTNRSLMHQWHDPAKGWGKWESLGGALTSQPKATSWGQGRLDIFARGDDMALNHLWHDPQKGWGSWESLGGNIG